MVLPPGFYSTSALSILILVLAFTRLSIGGVWERSLPTSPARDAPPATDPAGLVLGFLGPTPMEASSFWARMGTELRS